MEPRDDVISLQDYLVVLRRQRWVVALTTVLVVVAALGVAFAQTPLYESQTDLALDRVRTTGDVSLEQLLSPSNAAVETERLVMTSRPVADRVAADLGLAGHQDALDGVRVEAVRDTRVLRVIVTHPDPAAAAARADAFASAYLDVKRDQAVDEVLAARANLEERAADLRGAIAELDGELARASGQQDRQSLTLQRDALVSQLGQIIAQSSELGDASDSITGGGSVLTPAEVARTPVSPRPVRTGALALVLGLLLGVGFAFLRDYLDDVIRDEPDFKRSTGGRPLLGRIPHIETPGAADRLVTLVDPSALASEAYRELSAGVRFLLVTHGGPAGGGGPDDAPARGRSVMVSSASVGEGKTSTAANLAVAAARVGLRTVLVDCDLRKATVGRRFGLGRTTGLSDVLLSGDGLGDHVVDVGVENLRVLPAGTIPPNPAELLASPAMRALEHQLVSQADLVVYDTPAVLAVPDALELGRFVDLAIMVGRVGVTSRRQIHAAVERLEQVGTDLAGTVLNDLDASGDGYYYAYYYATEEEEAAPSRLSRLRPSRRRSADGRHKDRGGAVGGSAGDGGSAEDGRAVAGTDAAPAGSGAAGDRKGKQGLAPVVGRRQDAWFSSFGEPETSEPAEGGRAGGRSRRSGGGRSVPDGGQTGSEPRPSGTVRTVPAPRSEGSSGAGGAGGDGSVAESAGASAGSARQAVDDDDDRLFGRDDS